MVIRKKCRGQKVIQTEDFEPDNLKSDNKPKEDLSLGDIRL